MKHFIYPLEHSNTNWSTLLKPLKHSIYPMKHYLPTEVHCLTIDARHWSTLSNHWNTLFSQWITLSTLLNPLKHSLATEAFYLATEALYLATEALYLAIEALYLATEALYLAIEALFAANEALYLAIEALWSEISLASQGECVTRQPRLLLRLYLSRSRILRERRERNTNYQDITPVWRSPGRVSEVENWHVQRVRAPKLGAEQIDFRDSSLRSWWASGRDAVIARVTTDCCQPALHATT